MKISDKLSPKTKQAAKAGANAGVRRGGAAGKPGAAASVGGFKVETAAQSGPAGGVDASSGLASSSGPEATAPVDALQALIDLQALTPASDRERHRKKLLTAGQQALTLLERIQQGLLSGRVYKGDLKSLSEQTAQSAQLLRAADADPTLSGLYEDIALRARIELAKLER